MLSATATRNQAKTRELGVSGEPQAVSIEEAARIVGLSRSAIYNHLTGGHEPRLPSFKVGKRRLILRSAIPAWLEELAEAGR